MLRQAIASDIPDIQRIRHSVRENRLTSTKVSDRDVLDAIETRGRGWVVEMSGNSVAFAIGDSRSGNIWALFVHPDHERNGHGRQLHETMVEWLWRQGLARLWLNTEPRTRAQRFYESAGWLLVGATETGEVRYELTRPDRASREACRPSAPGVKVLTAAPESPFSKVQGGQATLPCRAAVLDGPLSCFGNALDLS